MSRLRRYHLKREVATHYQPLREQETVMTMILGILYKRQTNILM